MKKLKALAELCVPFSLRTWLERLVVLTVAVPLELELPFDDENVPLSAFVDG